MESDVSIGNSFMTTLGIDFGTCFSSAAYLTDGTLHAVKEPIRLGYSHPTSVYLEENGSMLVGQAAENKRRNLERYKADFKRDFGQTTPYKLGDRSFRPEELATAVFAKLKTGADAMTHTSTTTAIVTLPVSFGKHKADLLRKAAVAAGFDSGQITLVGEPMAAATYYLLKQDKSERVREGDLVLVYDLGGGTFDTALVRRKGNGFEQMGEPMGIEHCGGRDFDRAIAQDFLNGCSSETRGLLMATSEQARRAQRELQEFCVKVKHDLSETKEVEHDLLLPLLEPESYKLTRCRFNEMVAPFVSETVATAEGLVRKCAVNMNDVSLVLMVGGSCRIPFVGAEIQRRLSRPVAMVDEPELAVALGAALYGSERVGVSNSRRESPTPAPVNQHSLAPVKIAVPWNTPKEEVFF